MFGARHLAVADWKRCHRCVAFLLAALAGLLLVTPRAVAQEEALLSYDNPFPRPRPDSLTLWDAPPPAGSMATTRNIAAVEFTIDLKSFAELWHGDFDLSALFHYAEDMEHHGTSHATIHAGIGQYFPDQPVVALATNGAGFEDLHWVYVKLCLTF